jgi:hypothetical protein
VRGAIVDSTLAAQRERAEADARQAEADEQTRHEIAQMRASFGSRPARAAPGGA